MEEALFGFALSTITLATCFVASEDLKKKSETKVDKTMAGKCVCSCCTGDPLESHRGQILPLKKKNTFGNFLVLSSSSFITHLKYFPKKEMEYFLIAHMLNKR